MFGAWVAFWSKCTLASPCSTEKMKLNRCAKYAMFLDCHQKKWCWRRARDRKSNRSSVSGPDLNITFSSTRSKCQLALGNSAISFANYCRRLGKTRKTTCCSRIWSCECWPLIQTSASRRRKHSSILSSRAVPAVTAAVVVSMVPVARSKRCKSARDQSQRKLTRRFKQSAGQYLARPDRNTRNPIHPFSPSKRQTRFGEQRRSPALSNLWSRTVYDVRSARLVSSGGATPRFHELPWRLPPCAAPGLLQVTAGARSPPNIRMPARAAWQVDPLC
mmetsp:Transcript_32383/g.67636  ORF Transcript_32383/g.67636 Transcript_32383/m.67636 type:complete len:275 (+) Transcript_32383:1637-2461(+)